MPGRRAVPAAAVLLLLAAAPHAGAKPATICRQVTDKAGDTYLARPSRPQQDDALDLVSADVATNATTITAVVTLKKYAMPPASSPVGSVYEFEFRVLGTPDTFYLSASQSPGVGASFDVGYRQEIDLNETIPVSLGTATGAFDGAKNQVRISAPLSAFAGRATFGKGTKIGVMEVFAGGGARGQWVPADYGTGKKTYIHQAKTCVTVGK